MTDTARKIRTAIFTPLSYLYGAVTFVRNKLFDFKILRSVSFDIPVVCIGNISVGGTGKTPHTEYIIRLLQDKYKIAVLSRGYKRKTSGFILASAKSTPYDIGDEPYQIYQKFGNKIRVAVCEKRVFGIQELQRIDPDINLILLDDAFQHRFVKPKVSIVLTEYSRPLFKDKLLPLGRLRENIQAVRSRAEIVVVTKCPEDVKPVQFRLFKKELDLFPYQGLFFSKFSYGNLVPVFPEESTYIPYLDIFTPQDIILAVTGIANPRPLVKYLKGFQAQIRVMHYPDHHYFSRTDIDDIVSIFRSLKGRYKILMTTEKDAVRIANNPYFPFELKKHIFYQPVSVEFLSYESENFDDALMKAINRTIQ